MHKRISATPSSKQVADEHRRAAAKVMKQALRSKQAARDFLIEAGILTKDGKTAPAYRAA